MILVIPILVNLKNYIRNEKQIIFISILSSIIIFILAINIYFLLFNIDLNLNNLDMPVVYIIGKYYTQYKIIYGIVMLLSIFTTAISAGVSFLENISRNKKSFPHIAATMCITSIIISNFGFSNLVKILFPFFGFLGLVEIGSILNISKKNL